MSGGCYAHTKNKNKLSKKIGSSKATTRRKEGVSEPIRRIKIGILKLFSIQD